MQSQFSPEKMAEIMAKSYQLLPMGTDLPRLTNIHLYANGKRLPGVEVPEGAGDTMKIIYKLQHTIGTLCRLCHGEKYMADVLSKMKEIFFGSLSNEEEAPALITKDHINALLEYLGGDSSPVVAILKPINQVAISPATVELKLGIGMQNMTKDVRNSWYFEIHMNDNEVLVTSHKKDQCIKNLFQYEWLLSFKLAITRKKDIVTHVQFESVDLEIIDLLFHQDVHNSNPKKKEEIERAASKYIRDENVIKDSPKKYWEFYPDPTLGQSVPKEEFKPMLYVNTKTQNENPQVTHAKVYENGDKYEGVIEKGVRHGPGQYTSSNGSVYHGEYRNGKKHGKGIYKFATGAKIDGVFEDGVLITGTYTFANGDIYKGEFNSNKFEGKGTFHNSNGDCFEGMWKAGKKNGHGTLQLKSGDKYDGEWENDMMHGQGIYLFANGDKYSGSFVTGNIEGHGEYTFTKPGKKPLIGSFSKGKYVAHKK